MNITKDSIIADVLKSVPGSNEIFEKYNMGCLSCMGVQKESLEKGCLMHGMDVNKLIEELQKIVK
ncbi:MAG: DUF1858 domain-containing protein [Deferribacterales bacterium]|nr:DUF1858 domain-containing protein [Deferribacterales bacterium]